MAVADVARRAVLLLAHDRHAQAHGYQSPHDTTSISLDSRTIRCACGWLSWRSWAVLDAEDTE